MPGRRKFTANASVSIASPVQLAASPDHARRRSPVGLIESAMPQRLSSEFSAADLPGQYVLSRSDAAVPSGWVVHRLHGWTLGVHPTLPVVKLRTRDGAEAGWLLGHPIDESAEFIRSEAHLPFDNRATPGDMESWLARVSGQFLAIWLTPLFERVYLDAGGLLPAMYAKEHDLVASTTSLVPYARGCTDDVDLLRAAGVPHSKAMLAFGFTSRHGVQRLHPNHYLDLQNWSSRRHWPAEPLDRTVDPEEAIETVSRSIRRHITAAMRSGRFHMALTAGGDSRAILSCAREHLEHIDLFTLALPDRFAELDVEIARKLAARHGLPHRVLPYRTPEPSDLDGWLWRTGMNVAETRAWKGSHIYSALGDPMTPEISGIAGEAARVAYWRDAGEGRRELTPEVFADCLWLPHHAGVLAGIRAWMRSYPASTPVQLLDGFYIEQSLGTDAGLLALGDARYVRRRLHPFVDREALEAMSRLPEAYKLERRFQRDLIARHWPELLRTPLNRRPGLRHHIYRARRRVWLWRRALAGDRPAR
jgi:hypothetical protein